MADPRVIIIGAGPAGVRAAETLVEAGVRPIVVDEGARDGGQIYRRQPEGFTRPQLRALRQRNRHARRRCTRRSTASRGRSIIVRAISRGTSPMGTCISSPTVSQARCLMTR